MKMATKLTMILMLVLLLSLLDSSMPQQNEANIKSKRECPTWTKRVNSTSNCTCGDVTRDIVVCNNQTKKVHILDGYLMTYNEAEDTVEAGQTIYGWRRKHFSRGRKNLYYIVNRTMQVKLKS